MVGLTYANIYYIDLVVCIFSAISNLLIFVAYIYFRDLRNYSFRLVFYLAISELLTCTGNHHTAFLLPTQLEPSSSSQVNISPMCEAQAIILNFSCLSSVLWTSVYAFTLYRSLALEKKDGWKYEVYYLLYAFGIPLCLNLLPSINSNFGEAEGWCWISIEKNGTVIGFIDGNMWRIISYLVPVWIVIVFNIVMYSKLIRIISRITENVEDGQISMANLYNRLKCYPFILLMCHLPVTVHRMLGLFGYIKEDQIWLSSLMASFFLILSGFLNAVVYGLTDRVKQELQKLMYQTSSDSSSYSVLSASESEENAKGSTNTI